MRQFVVAAAAAALAAWIASWAFESEPPPVTYVACTMCCPAYTWPPICEGLKR